LVGGKQPPDEECCVELPRLNSLPVERGWRAEEVAETSQRGIELVDLEELDVVMKDRDLELIIEEREPCLEN
jgi:hypothetical protein